MGVQVCVCLQLIDRQLSCLPAGFAGWIVDPQTARTIRRLVDHPIIMKNVTMKLDEIY
jgi:hypothetical protein